MASNLLNLLQSVDIELISILEQNNLRPKNEGEFFEVLRDLDKNTIIVNAIISYSNEYTTSIAEWYAKRDKEDIKLIIDILQKRRYRDE